MTTRPRLPPSKPPKKTVLDASAGAKFIKTIGNRITYHSSPFFQRSVIVLFDTAVLRYALYAFLHNSYVRESSRCKKLLCIICSSCVETRLRLHRFVFTSSQDQFSHEKIRYVLYPIVLCFSIMWVISNCFTYVVANYVISFGFIARVTRCP